MANHPEDYVMSREEWLEINSVLAGCCLSLQRHDSRERTKRNDRLLRVKYAQQIMSEVYQRAADKAS